MVSEAKVRDWALGMPQVEERSTWGHPTFRVREKIFVILNEEDRSARVRTSKEEQEALIASDSETFDFAPYVGRHGWTRVALRRVKASEMRELVVEAWRRTAPKRLVAEFEDEG